MCNSAPSAPQLPSFPGLTSDESNILQQMGMSLSQFSQLISGTGSQLSGNQQVLQQMSGLLNPDGSVNQTALQSLQQRTQQSLSTQSTAAQGALGYLGNLYSPGGVAQAQTTAYQNALNGNIPANQQLQFTTGQNFQAMKEQAAQQGIIINGDDWNSATSSSTAGQKLLQNFQQNYNIQNQNYQLGYLNTAGANMSALSSTAANTANTGLSLANNANNAQLGYLGQSITSGQSALAPLLTSFQGGLSQEYTPYEAQQLGPYQQAMAQAQATYQAGLQGYQGSQSNMFGLGSLGTQALGMGLNYSLLSGMGAAGTAGTAAGGSALLGSGSSMMAAAAL